MTNIGAHLLGRHVRHDPASRGFPADRSTPAQRSVFWHHYGPVLDQGNLGSCTANALDQWLNTKPQHVVHGKMFREADALALYHVETVLQGGDQYPPDDPGGSSLGVCKAAKSMALITSYQHIFGHDHALAAIPLGPFITGVNWYEGFFQPDSKGLITISGPVVGGHEFLVTGYSPRLGVWRCLNSWGKSWGVKGVFFMTTETFARLLAEDGDAAVPML